MDGKRTLGDGVRALVEDVKYFRGVLGEAGRALVSGDKRRLLLLLSLGSTSGGLSSCEKGGIFDLDCKYGTVAAQVTQDPTTLNSGPQNNVSVPIIINIDEWSECTPNGLLKIEGYIINNADGRTIPNSNFFQLLSGLPVGQHTILQGVNVPQHCRGITVRYTLSSDRNSLTGEENRKAVDTGSLVFNVTP